MSSILAIFDLDGTLCSGHILDGFIKYYVMHRRRRAWILAFWATHLPIWLLSKFKLISREECKMRWLEDMIGVFKGASREEIQEVFHWVAKNHIFKSLRSDVVGALKQHKQSGHMLAIVSTASSEFLKIVGQRLGVPNVIGTKLEIIDDRYSGKIVKPLCFGENKAKLLKEFIARNELEIDCSSSFAYADSIFDVPLLKLVGNPVATYPDRNLRQFALANGWKILP